MKYIIVSNQFRTKKGIIGDIDKLSNLVKTRLYSDYKYGMYVLVDDLQQVICISIKDYNKL